MMRCPECKKRLPGDLDRFGARCPACRAPLYDRPPGRRDVEDGCCAVHPDNAALDTCGRCGNYLCATCRTRWRERWWCAACVDLALQRQDAVPEEARAHLRQALLALGLGLSSWVLFLAGGLLGVAAQAGGESGVLFVPAILLILASPLPSALGLGQGIAAIRARGDHMVLATLGLVLCGLNVGVMIMLFSFGVSVNV